MLTNAYCDVDCYANPGLQCGYSVHDGKYFKLCQRAVVPWLVFAAICLVYI